MLYIVITLLLGFAAINTGNNLLFLVVSGLLAFMSISGIAGMLNLTGLSPQLLAPEELFAGAFSPFRLMLNNRKRYLPSFLLSVECQGGQKSLIPYLATSSHTDSTVSLRFPRRGLHSVGRVVITSPFPINFFVRYVSFDLDDEVVVFPRLLPSEIGGAGVGSGYSGHSRLNSRGIDGELERIAPYSGREPLKMIHWRLSARGDELLVKEFGHQMVTPLMIDIEENNLLTLDERLSMAAWLVKRWIDERPVGLRFKNRSIPSGAGHAHGRMLLTELALYDGN